MADDIHPSHTPETLRERVLPGMTFCKVCNRLLKGDRCGVRPRALSECEGPRRLVLRANGEVATIRG